MEVLVALSGGLIAAVGVVGFGAPRRLLEVFLNLESGSRFYLMMGTRLSLAVALLLGASTSRFSTTIFVLGAITIVAALAVALLGRTGMDSFLQSWRSRPDFLLRASFLAAALFGGFLMYAGL